jgi:hypothetical protein
VLFATELWKNDWAGLIASVAFLLALVFEFVPLRTIAWVVFLSAGATGATMALLGGDWILVAVYAVMLVYVLEQLGFALGIFRRSSRT